MSFLLGVDIGTSGTKSVLFDETGRTIASATVEYPLYQPKVGWAEQEPEDWWNAAVDSIKAVISKSGANKHDIVGIGLSGQMHGLVMLGKDGKPLRRSIIWCDQRTDKECAEMTEKIGAKRLIEITANPAMTGFTASKILWVKNNEPEIYEKCVKILLPKDYIRYMLTGEFAAEVSDASGMQLLDVPARQWSGEVLEKLGIDKGLLAPVYELSEQETRASLRARGYARRRRGRPAGGVGNGLSQASVGAGTPGFCAYGQNDAGPEGSDIASTRAGCWCDTPHRQRLAEMVQG